MMRNILTRLVPYVLATLICLLILWFVYDLWGADLRVPFRYYGDALFYAMVIKGTMDNGWYLHNEYLGMPYGLDLHDFPLADSLHVLIIKFIMFIAQDWGTAMNIYFILSFPLAMISAMYVMRSFGISSPIAAVSGLLFAFLPFHFLRGEGHLFLTAYYLVPVMVMLAIWVYRDGIHSTGDGSNQRGIFRLFPGGRTLAAVIICLSVASAGLYYSFFGCFFLVVAGVAAAFAAKRLRPLLVSLVLTAVVMFGLAANIAPSILYKQTHGPNKEVAGLTGRSPMESELYGLKVIQLLLPTNGHRIKKLADIKYMYNASAPLVNENQTASLGIIGGTGFLILIGWIFVSHKATMEGEQAGTLRILALMNLSGVLLASIGSFGSVFAHLVSPQIRAYNRISVYIGFFSVFLIALLLEKASRRFAVTPGRKALFISFLTVMLALGVFDQTGDSLRQEARSGPAEFYNDERFVRRIEAMVPPRSMILQLPYDEFLPIGLTPHRMSDYDHFRAYYHSKSLRWSYGAMMGRQAGLWQKYVLSRPVDELVEASSHAGFKGIYIDRNGYRDGGAAVEKAIHEVIGATPIISENKRFVFFSIADVAADLTKNSDIRAAFGPSGIKKLAQVRLPAITNDLSYSVDRFDEYKDFVSITGWAFINGKSAELSTIRIALKSEAGNYLTATHPMPRPDVTKLFKGLNFDDSGFSCIIAKEALNPGIYDIGIHVVKNGAESLQFTGRTLTVGR
ncbi:MAG TPA: hypothetical protein VN260_08100 [Dissulfurispiraceae bacterium]|nr:hypothetical protein [Dissulfurispiraceae bacterium]